MTAYIYSYIFFLLLGPSGRSSGNLPDSFRDEGFLATYLRVYLRTYLRRAISLLTGLLTDLLTA